MGLTKQFDHPVFKVMMATIKNETNLAGVPCGVHVVEPSEILLKQRINEGYRFIAYSIDGVVLSKFTKNPLL